MRNCTPIMNTLRTSADLVGGDAASAREETTA